MPRSRFARRLTAPVIVSLFLALAPVARAAADYVWVEGEQPASANVKWNNAGSSHGDWLSGQKWLTVTVDEEKVEKEVPADGAVLEYKVPVGADGKYELWARLGFEFARSAFDWRIDAGEWTSVTHDALTVDAMELDFFAEAAWLKLGDPQLAKGDHTLTIRVPRATKKDGKFEHVLFGLDAICLSREPFHPLGPYKPDENHRTAKDEEAAKQTFALPAPKAAGERASVALQGLWEVCRDDELLPKDVDQPIKELPEHAIWGAIPVPSDRDESRPDLLFGHRLWYRTRVNVPADFKGRSFVLTFPQNCLNTTVYVNDVLCGFNNNPFVHFDLDVTKGVKPGQVNEVWVGIRDAWYGYASSPTDPMKLRRHFNLPPQFTHSGFQDLAYPIWGAWHSGILATPTFTAAGHAYASDVFVKPSVANKALEVEVTLSNPTAAPIAGDVLCEAIDPKTGQVALSLNAKPFRFAAGAEQVLNASGGWTDAKLWWPDEPNLYTLRTTVRVNGQPIDVANATFGFREWGSRGKDFTLNGIVWHGWNMGVNGTTPDEWLNYYHKTNQNQMRLSGAAQGGYRPFFGMNPDETLDWMDRNGVPVRRCGILDGEAIGYMAIENDPELKKLYGSEVKMQLMRNWLPQMVAQVRAERNHPCVQVWSIENEWLFINTINLYGGLMDQFEAEVKKVSDAVQKIDPTHLVMTDGGGANKDNAMPVHGNHYVALSTGGLTSYPAMAYTADPTGGGRGRWTWDQQRPRYIGEDFFFTGNHPELSTIGGEAALTGKSATLKACGLMLSILQQGYRWADFGAWDFYCGPSDADDSQFTYFAPRAALVREWDWTFASGATVKRTVGLFNDTHHDDPISFTWRLMVNGKEATSKQADVRVAPGTHTAMPVEFTLPAASQRQESTLELVLSVKGQEVFRDSKAISILPAPAKLASIKEGELLVLDPAGKAADYLKKLGVAFAAVNDVAALADHKDAKVLLVGKDAIGATQRTSPQFAAWAAAGRSVIVLEQKEPLEYQAIPAEVEPATNSGLDAFIDDASHPAFAGLKDKDFFTWGADEIVYRNAYGKPTRGAKSLLACDELLKDSALIEVPVEKGLLILSQLALEEKLTNDPVAQTLLNNLLTYAAGYKQTFRPTTVTAADGSQLKKVASAIGLTHVDAKDVLDAISAPGEKVAVIEATPANLKQLASNLDKVNTFTTAGGWIVFNGLTPEGLADYNKVVGVDHMIRPFKRERVTFPASRSPLTAGITGGDIAMYSSKRIFPWTEGNYVVSDEFSFCVDYDDVAPFAKSSFFAFDNIVDGFTNADGWPLIINWEIPKTGYPSVPMTWPTPQTITELTWVGNTNYWGQTKVRLVFDGDEKNAATFDTQPTGDAQTFSVTPPRIGKDITLQITGYQEKQGTKPLVGIDNIALKAERPPEFYQHVRPMVNVGGMMKYPRGQGGIVLCNLLFKDDEEVALNAVKKRTILTTILRNLKSPFTGGRAVIVGTDLAYAPIDISKQANQYRTERGWFGEKRFTFAELPTGKQTFAGVPFDVYEFATSPVPTVIMLGGANVPNNLPEQVTGIPVHRKADALFFLQAARIDKWRNEQEKKESKRYELAKYVIHYADGQTAEVPVYAEVDVENYHQKSPQPLPGAQVAWERPYEGTDDRAVAYSKQWNNPRPDAEIATIDLVAGKDKAGVPALLAITAASGK